MEKSYTAEEAVALAEIYLEEAQADRAIANARRQHATQRAAHYSTRQREAVELLEKLENTTDTNNQSVILEGRMMGHRALYDLAILERAAAVAVRTLAEAAATYYRHHNVTKGEAYHATAQGAARIGSEVRALIHGLDPDTTPPIPPAGFPRMD